MAASRPPVEAPARPAGDDGLRILRWQATELVPGRPSRLARQMPGASAGLVTWLGQWEGRHDDARSGAETLAELSAHIAASRLNAAESSRLSRAMGILDPRPTVRLAWLGAITDAADRDLASVEKGTAEHEALAVQVHASIGPVLWEHNDLVLTERFARTMTAHLPEESDRWQWMATGAAMALHLQGLGGDVSKRAAAEEELRRLCERDLSTWGPQQIAELDYVTALVAYHGGDNEKAIEHAQRAAETSGYHHAQPAAGVWLQSLSRLDRHAEADEVFSWAARTFEMSEEDSWQLAQILEDVKQENSDGKHMEPLTNPPDIANNRVP